MLVLQIGWLVLNHVHKFFPNSVDHNTLSIPQTNRRALLLSQVPFHGHLNYEGFSSPAKSINTLNLLYFKLLYFLISNKQTYLSYDLLLSKAHGIPSLSLYYSLLCRLQFSSQSGILVPGQHKALWKSAQCSLPQQPT